MSWTAPATAVVGQVLTASFWNTNVRDDLNYLYGASPIGLYRKVTSKQVVNTITLTDLLNGEITVAANAVGASGVLRFTAWGDMLNNTGSAQNTPSFALKLGATTVVTLAAIPTPWNASAVRQAWRLQAEIANLAAANSQWTTMALRAIISAAGATAVTDSPEGYGFLPAPAGGVAALTHIAAGSSAVDTTASQALQVMVGNAVASASYDVTLRAALVEISASS